ncbi:MAG: hypothetical protein WCP12_09210 [bacterium]
MNVFSNRVTLIVLLGFTASLCRAVEPVATDRPAPSHESFTSSQIDLEFRLIEAPKTIFDAVFGQKKGETFSGEVPETTLRTLLETKEADILSAPRICTLEGQTAQIKIANEIQYASGFRFNATNGLYELENKKMDLGIFVTVVATPYPYDPERLHGAAEISYSRLLKMQEQTFTPQGTEKNLILQNPTISTTSLTAAFDIQSGKTIVLGRLDSDEGTVPPKQTYILLKANVVASEESALIAKLKKKTFSACLKNAPLSEAMVLLNKQAEPLTISFSYIRPAGDAANKENLITLSLNKVTLYDAVRLIANIAGASIRIQGNTVLFISK